MNAIARYLLVFLLGWSGAAWTYIYKTSKTPEKTETQKITNDLSLPDALKPDLMVTNGLSSQNVKQNPPASTPKQEQPTEEQNMSQ